MKITIVDLREEGVFSSRMEAKDGSMGFDFAGTYTKVVKHAALESALGDRNDTNTQRLIQLAR